MISNETKKLINLAILNLELENPTQETINKATNYLKEAILQIKKEKEETEEELQEYKEGTIYPYVPNDLIEDLYKYLKCR